MGQVSWRRIAGLQVVMAWPDSSYAAPPPRDGRNLRKRAAAVAGAVLIIVGAAAVGVAVSAQRHAPQPATDAAGVTGPGRSSGLPLPASVPVSIAIPAIGVASQLLHLGLAGDGSIQVPALPAQAGDAAWYRYSVTPGQAGTSVIEGHLDSYQGPAVFFRLGALHPGDTVSIQRADGVTAVFRVTGVRRYPKSGFPAKVVYGPDRYPGLRLITCGGTFDYATRHYLASVVVFAALTRSRRAA